MSCEIIRVFWLGPGELGDLTKLQHIFETLQSSEDDDDDDDNVGGVRTHGNPNDIARDNFLDISTVIYVPYEQWK